MSVSEIEETLNVMAARLGYRRLMDRVGGASEVAKQLNVSKAAVSAWRFRGVPVKHLDKLRLNTGLQLHELRPDLFSDPAEDHKQTEATEA